MICCIVKKLNQDRLGRDLKTREAETWQALRVESRRE